MGIAWSETFFTSGYYPGTSVGYMTSGPNRKFVMYPQCVRELPAMCPHCGTQYLSDRRLQMKTLIELKAAYRKAVEEKIAATKNILPSTVKPSGWKVILRSIRKKNNSIVPCSQNEFENLPVINDFNTPSKTLPCCCPHLGQGDPE